MENDQHILLRRPPDGITNIPRSTFSPKLHGIERPSWWRDRSLENMQIHWPSKPSVHANDRNETDNLNIVSQYVDSYEWAKIPRTNEIHGNLNYQMFKVNLAHSIILLKEKIKLFVESSSIALCSQYGNILRYNFNRNFHKSENYNNGTDQPPNTLTNTAPSLLQQ